MSGATEGVVGVITASSGAKYTPHSLGKCIEWKPKKKPGFKQTEFLDSGEY
jgi:hypothetical protein